MRRRSASPRPTQKNLPVKRSYQAPAVPPTLVAEVVPVGAMLCGRVLHRDLAGIEWHLHAPKGLTLHAGQFVKGTPHPTERALLLVTEVVIPARAAVAAAVANHALPHHFEPTEEAAAAALPAYRYKVQEARNEAREDWRSLPFVTIDGEDAKDFDDAVWAAPWNESGTTGGFHVRVAIADVAHYVAAGSVLDALARTRGNSTYFPGAVIPMLPERLSNDLCSLNPHTVKPVLAAELWLNAVGDLHHYRFCRAVIHSAKRCTYNEVQAHLNGTHLLPAALHGTMQQLHAAFLALLKQREARGAITLDVPELALTLDAHGAVTGAAARPRLAAHMLIEELMIAANVAAATALSTGCADTRPGQPRQHHAGQGVYRVHAQPSKEKLESLRAVLTPLGFTAPPPNGRPATWAALAARVQGHPAAPTLQKALLQAQMQAQYATDNIGHFGLALPLYTHFTSPIRRYADLLVHRALLAMLDKDTPASPAMETLCAGMNLCERRSQQAEWEARDRLLAGWLTSRVGEVFSATVTGVAPFGCFVALGDTGAEALLPKWKLEGYMFIGGQQAFRRVQGGKGLLRCGSAVQVVLLQADFAAGRLTVGLAPSAGQRTRTAAPLTRPPKRR